MTLIVFENSNLILGFIPESVGMLVFSFVLIFLAVGLRWTLDRFENDASIDDEPRGNLLELSAQNATAGESQRLMKSNPGEVLRRKR